MAIRLVESSTITDKIERCKALAVAHWEELAKNKQLMVLNLDVQRYAQLERAGMLFGIWAYEGDDIVGYSINVFGTNLHYADLVYAQNDLLFVSKEHRTGTTGLKLIKETERVAKERGAKMLIWHAKEHSTLESLFRKPRFGYGIQDIMFSKEL